MSAAYSTAHGHVSLGTVVAAAILGCVPLTADFMHHRQTCFAARGTFAILSEATEEVFGLPYIRSVWDIIYAKNETNKQKIAFTVQFRA